MNRRTYYLGILALLILLGIVGTGNAQEEIEVDVTLKEFKVEMSRTSLPVNTPIKFVVTNNGTIEHEVVLEKAGMVDEPLEIGGQEAEIEKIQPGETKSAVWIIDDAGNYQLACHTPGHFEGGMYLPFTVASGGGSFLNQPLAWVVGVAILAVVLAFFVLQRRSLKAKGSMA